MLLTELTTADIPELYQRFARVVGDKHWKKRVSALKAEATGNRFLADYFQAENGIAFQLERCRNLATRHGDIPQAEAENEGLYSAISFAAQVLSMMDISPREYAERLRRRVRGALNNPDDMRALQLELTAATHFVRRGHDVVWPEMSGLGTFDLLVENIGDAVLEIECKSISDDKGRRVHRRDVLEFYNSISPHLKPIQKGLTTGLSVVLTVPGRLPTRFKDRKALAKRTSQQILAGRSAKFDDGSAIKISEFDVTCLGNLVNGLRRDILRAAIDDVTATSNRDALIIGARTGGVLALAAQSAADDTLMDSTFNTLSTAAKKQFTGTRPAIFIVGLNGLNGEELLSIAHQDLDPAQHPTLLRRAVSKFLSGQGRDHVVGVGFLSRSAFLPMSNATVDSGGTAYFFPKRESTYWHDDFSGLFSLNACRTAIR